MKNVIKSKFSFFKAGQGSFYGGRIWNRNDNRTYTIVYDCGTRIGKSLKNEIDSFKSCNYFPPTIDIDLLFISHLDNDHVSSLKYVLKEFNVKKIILPYIEEEKRQFFLVSYYSSEESDEAGMTSEEYTSFIASPHEFIKENSDGTQIFFVNPSDSRQESYLGYNLEAPIENNPYPRGTKLNEGKIPNELKGIEAPIQVYDNNLQFFIKKEWEFTTYVKDVNDRVIEELKNSLKRLVRKGVEDDLSFEDLKEIVKNKKGKAKDCYVKHLGDINAYGLVLLHGPIEIEYVKGGMLYETDLNQGAWVPLSLLSHIYRFKYEKSSILGTLLFGDTSIKPSINPVNFPAQFKEKLKSVHVVQIPHHGSKKSWDSAEFRKLRIGESRDGENKTISVCNFGYGNTFGHPSQEVLYDLAPSIFLNTQFSRVTICYEIEYN